MQQCLQNLLMTLELVGWLVVLRIKQMGSRQGWLPTSTHSFRYVVSNQQV